MSLELFENLWDGDVNPQEVLKNQVKFKSELSKIKTGSNKSEDIFFFNLGEKIIQLFRYYSFLLSETKYKAKVIIVMHIYLLKGL